MVPKYAKIGGIIPNQSAVLINIPNGDGSSLDNVSNALPGRTNRQAAERQENDFSISGGSDACQPSRSWIYKLANVLERETDLHQLKY